MLPNPKSLFTCLLVFTALVVCLSWPSGLLAKKKGHVPDDFEVLIQSLPRIPMSQASTIKIRSNGHCKYYESPKGRDLDFVLINEFDLDADAMKKIYETVKKEKFFELKKEYKDSNVVDGDLAVMQIVADGKRHVVKTVNIKVDAFDNIVREVNAHLPKGVRISYNALHVDDYKRVER